VKKKYIRATLENIGDAIKIVLKQAKLREIEL